MATSVSSKPLFPRVEFPRDPGLLELPRLFDPEWLLEAVQRDLGWADRVPQAIHIRQFTHSPGRRAVISYLVEWDPEEYLPADHLMVRLERGERVRLYQFPDDPDLPGLKLAADPEGALALMKRHVLAIGDRRVRVEVVRYRPGSRAVLRHRVGRAGFFARTLPPASLPAFLRGWELIGRSRFIAPRIAGCWNEGGVVWMSEIPGRNLRRCIRRGDGPDPEPLLDGLESLWRQGPADSSTAAYNLPGGYRQAKRIFTNAARQNTELIRTIKRLSGVLDPFIESWQPVGIAHNDFYDDQLIVAPDGRMALVDFEEAGPGDPLLDVGNFLAHLRWRMGLGSASQADIAAHYHRLFQDAALQRFRWNARDLALREAVCLFRLCTNMVRQPQENWEERLQNGLGLVREMLE